MSVDPRVPIVVVQIDWTDTDAYENVTDDIRAQPGISIQRGKDAARARAQPMVNAADFTLDNQDHRYTAENAGSDLYPYVLPDRPVVIGTQEGEDLGYEAALTYNEPATTYNSAVVLPLFTGYTDEPQEVNGGHGVERHVQFRALGAMSTLRGQVISTLLTENIRTDEAIVQVLDAAGWPADKRAISTGDTAMNFWWVDQEDAWNALVTLLETEGAGSSLYEDGDGVIHFENRLYRSINARSTTSQATFDTAGAGVGFTAYSYTQGTRDIYNDVRMTVDIGHLDNAVVIWELGNSQLTLGANEVRVLTLHLTDPIDVITTPVLTTDYTVPSGSLVSYTASRTYANEIVLTFTAGAGGAVVEGPSGRGPQVRGDQFTVLYQEQVTQTAAPDPIFASRARSLDLRSAGVHPVISLATAEALCDASASFYSAGRPSISIEVFNRDEDRLTQILGREISDRVTVDVGGNEFTGDVWIEQITHGITFGGRIMRMGIIGMKVVEGSGYIPNPASWDDGVWDTDVWGN